ncbi:hypothetical protein HAX54_027349, partial [Datura stramonium]|nr:hypothetical protein [Datura stramonium]
IPQLLISRRKVPRLATLCETLGRMAITNRSGKILPEPGPIINEQVEDVASESKIIVEDDFEQKVLAK